MVNTYQEKILLEKLNKIIIKAKKNSPYYKNKIPFESLKEISDLKLIPVLTKEDLLNCSKFFPSLLATDIPSSSYVFSTGGTTGIPKLIYRSIKESYYNAELVAQAFKLSGVSEKDVVANLLPVGKLYSGLIPLNQALEKINCTILPISDNASNEELLKFLRFFPVTTILSIPTHIVTFANYLEKENVTDIKVKRIITGGEKLYPLVKNYLRKILGIEYFVTNYASTEAGAIGYQCEKINGTDLFHIHSNNQYLEILDQETWKEVPIGNEGRIIATNLSRELMPLIRYELGDVGRIIIKKCSCGSEDQLFELIGRGYERIRIGYSFIDIKHMTEIISKIPELTPNFQIKVNLKNSRDQLTITIETINIQIVSSLKDKFLKLLLEESLLYEDIEADIINPIEIKIVDLNTIERNSRTGKIKQFIDQREEIKFIDLKKNLIINNDD
jgi:phenylacetate-coenzyme A ligase PaaK-like adenylate-forming protein